MCDRLEAAPYAELTVAETDGLEGYLGATVDLSPHALTLEFEDAEFNRWRVTYDVAVDF